MILVYILLALVVAGVAAFMLMYYGSEYFRAGADFAAILGLVLMAATGITTIAYAFTVYSWVASDYKADIINREYGTNYTKEEVFFASDVIDTVRELNRQRIEVNGDLINGKEK